MAAKQQPTQHSPTGYKAALLKLGEMRGQSGSAAFDRATLAVTVFDDRDFRADLGNVDDFRAGQALDPYFEDLCLEFLQLRALLEHYPEREQWAAGRLATMRREMLAARSTTGSDGQSHLSRPRPSWKTKAKALEQQLTKVQGGSRKTSREATSLRAQLDQAKARIRELEVENADLRRQLLELCNEPALA
ncbi:MAG TPA: hypothetical protein VMZ06_00140 [Candidatus Bathyarchaeia archaeon]|nr:hypothetical protein [Candidatus Bathyarchaeia archaeon]